jgi:hypothetical protein
MSGLSSVTHEQKNRYLDKLKTSSVFMRWDVFTSILVNMVANLNYRERVTRQLLDLKLANPK